MTGANPIRTTPRLGLVGLTALLVGCSDAGARIAGPLGGQLTAILSDPAPHSSLALTTTAAKGHGTADSFGPVARVPSALSIAYMSLPPGTAPAGVDATVRNERTGETIQVVVVDGGFDPVPVEAQAGDRLELTVAGPLRPNMYSAAERAPAKRAPKVVRTVPPRGKTDVPLNARIVVVFSEPIDGRTLTPQTLRLRRGADVISGRVVLTAHGLRAEFEPDGLLAAEAEYVLTIATGIADLQGDRLETPIDVAFKTGTTGNVVETLPALAYAGTVDGNTDIYVTTENPTRPRRLTTAAALDAEPAWSPDGTRIAFRSERDGNPEIYVMNADGTDVTQLTNVPAPDYHPTWSPDGSKIAFVSERDGNAEIYVMSADGTSLLRLTNHLGADDSPSWSPAGGKIAFRSDRDANGEIYAMNADGSSLVRLTENDVDDADPAWSPDGTLLAFSRFVPTPGFTTCITEEDNYNTMCGWDVLMMNADGSQVTRMALPTSAGVVRDGWWRSVFVAREPAWAPNGRSIAVAVFYCLSDFGGADCHGESPILILPVGATAFVEPRCAASCSTLTPGPSETAHGPAWRP